MKFVFAGFGAIVLTVLIAMPAQAAGDDVFNVVSDMPFGDVAQGVEDAIVNKGYKVDYHGFIGDMLKRTAKDVGASRQLYKNAEIFSFCSAVVSRSVMEADISDIAYCPYVIYVYEDAATPGKVIVGHRKLPQGGARDQVNALLNAIVKTAADGF